MSEDLLVQIYNAFDSKRPLGPDSPFYVDCHAVRGQENIIKEVGRSIVLIERLNQFILGAQRNTNIKWRTLRMVFG